MQFPPDAPELLAAIGRLLDDEVIAAVPADLQHRVRVAAHLAHLVEREVRLGPEGVAAERAALIELLGEEDADASTLAARLRDHDDPDFERRAWDALVAITRRDLAIAKPGHDGWEGT